MDKISTGISCGTGLYSLYALSTIKEVIGLIILLLSLANILLNLFIKVRAKIKNKNYEGISNDLDDTKEQLENLINKEDE